MITIKKVLDSGRCAFCNHDKEVVSVAMDGQPEVLLCWADLKKHAQVRMRMNGAAPPPVAAVATPAKPTVPAK